MRIYVCGPMSGYHALNEPEFRAVARLLEDGGYEVVVPHDVEPHEHTGPCPSGPAAVTQGKHGVACYLRTDVAALLTCDSVFVLHGWQASVGARLEVQVAAACGLRIEFQL